MVVKIEPHNPVPEGPIVFYDALVLLGMPGINMTEKQVRLVGSKIKGVNYWIATNRYGLSGAQIATAYKLRWDFENFFAWCDSDPFN